MNEMEPASSTNRSDQEWVHALSGKLGRAAQQSAHEDLSKYLFRAAYNYLLKRQVHLAPLAGFASDELTELARDFVQETQERLAHNGYFLLTKYSGTGRFTSWMAQVIYRQAASELRRPYWRRRNWVPNDQEIDPGADEADNPEVAAMLTQVNQVLSDCLQKLSPRYRMALLRCIVEDERAEVLAAELDITANAVYLLVHRGKQNLRKCVVKSGVDSDIFGIF
ncbi:MAG: sigma-70 family RNA polymerase sigma factor [Caldilineaceae bacterium]|nr:sigma-70 family RNA polymerase sigma factor [Caldilineaceae bacterium]